MGLPYLVVIDLTAKIHPPHVLHQDVHSVSLLSGDVYYQCVVSLQQALEHLHIQTHPYQVQGHNTSLYEMPGFVRHVSPPPNPNNVLLNG